MKPIFSAKVPKPVGPYSPAIRAGNFVFCSGQVALDPATGTLVDGDVTAQTEQVMKNVAAVLEAAGADFGDVVKTTVFLTEMADFPAVNAAYGRHFGKVPPARSTVAVAALPLGARVEIEVIARK
ncbi:MAG: RidA family protein [Vulcanimicrobiaceae bacterium]